MVYGRWQQNRNTFPNHGRNIRFLSLFLLFRCLYKGAFRLILWQINANDMSKMWVFRASNNNKGHPACFLETTRLL